MSDTAIHQMTADVRRISCDRVLLSPDLHQACLDMIGTRNLLLCSGPCLQLTGDVFVCGVHAERCDALSGVEYALVPKARTESITLELDEHTNAT